MQLWSYNILNTIRNRYDDLLFPQIGRTTLNWTSTFEAQSQLRRRNTQSSEIPSNTTNNISICDRRESTTLAGAATTRTGLFFVLAFIQVVLLYEYHIIRTTLPTGPAPTIWTTSCVGFPHVPFFTQYPRPAPQAHSPKMMGLRRVWYRFMVLDSAHGPWEK